MRNTWIIGLLALGIIGCLEEEQISKAENETSLCRGEWSEKDESGLVIKRFTEYFHEGMDACVTENQALTQWDKSLYKRHDHGIACTPQNDLPTMWLRASNNYYTYRNDKIFLELDSSTGEARRMIIGETPDGELSFERQVFCYYLRTDTEAEPVNPQDYGPMLLFDLEVGASSGIFHPMEIYNYNSAGNDLFLTKMDDNTGLDWTWCPTSTPIGFCDYLRNGNIMFYPPAPDAVKRAQLRAEAILIRSQMNFIRTSESEFQAAWDSAIENDIEVGTGNYISADGAWRYILNSMFDEPLFIGRAWRDYLRGDWPFMPDVASASTLQMPQVCYSAEKELILDDGSEALIEGEVCYVDGDYVFTQ